MAVKCCLWDINLLAQFSVNAHAVIHGDVGAKTLQCSIGKHSNFSEAPSQNQEFLVLDMEHYDEKLAETSCVYIALHQNM